MTVPVTAITTGAALPAAPTRADAAPIAPSVEPLDAAQFRAMFEQRLSLGPYLPATPAAAGAPSLGERMVTRMSELGSGLERERDNISKSLEQASRSGDPLQMMKAVLSLNDYETRTQFIAKVGSKATSAVEQLTKLQ